MSENNDSGRPTLMQVTVGITEKRLTANPLGLEAEMSEGPDDLNPYRSVQEAEAVREIERKQDRRRDDKLWKTMQGTKDVNDDVSNPVGGDSDPFVFDDLGLATFDLPEFGSGAGDSDPFGLEAFDPANDQGPQF